MDQAPVLQLTVTEPSGVQVPLEWPPGKIPFLAEIEVWEWRGVAREEGKEAEAWLTSYLGRPCKLFRYMGNVHLLPPSRHFAHAVAVVRFSAPSPTATQLVRRAF